MAADRLPDPAEAICPGCKRPMSVCQAEDVYAVDEAPVSAAVSPAEPPEITTDSERMVDDEGTRLGDDRRAGSVTRSTSVSDGGDQLRDAAGRDGVRGRAVDSLDADAGSGSDLSRLRRTSASVDTRDPSVSPADDEIRYFTQLVNNKDT